MLYIGIPEEDSWNWCFTWKAQNEAGAYKVQLSVDSKEYIINCNRRKASLAQSYGGSNGVAIASTKNVTLVKVQEQLTWLRNWGETQHCLPGLSKDQRPFT